VHYSSCFPKVLNSEKCRPEKFLKFSHYKYVYITLLKNRDVTFESQKWTCNYLQITTNRWHRFRAFWTKSVGYHFVLPNIHPVFYLKIMKFNLQMLAKLFFNFLFPNNFDKVGRPFLRTSYLYVTLTKD